VAAVCSCKRSASSSFNAVASRGRIRWNHHDERGLDALSARSGVSRSIQLVTQGSASHVEIEGRTLRQVEGLAREIEEVFQRVVEPYWGSGYPFHGMARTAYGYIMNCLAFVDVLSRYRTDQAGGQTNRMIAFLVDYLGYSDSGSRVLVQLWRHNLMHTGNPGLGRGSRTQQSYKYLMQWGAKHLPRDQHMRFQAGSGDPRILNIGVAFLAGDLLEGAKRYFDDVRRSEALQERLLSAHVSVSKPASFPD
jgi:hypothetical protein